MKVIFSNKDLDMYLFFCFADSKILFHFFLPLLVSLSSIFSCLSAISPDVCRRFHVVVSIINSSRCGRKFPL